jgi:hypothetical protein
LEPDQGLNARKVSALHQRLYVTGLLALHWLSILGHDPISLDLLFVPLTLQTLEKGRPITASALFQLKLSNALTPRSCNNVRRRAW